MKYLIFITSLLFVSCNSVYANKNQLKEACAFIKVELIDTIVGYSNMMQNYDYNNAKNVIDNKYKLAQIYTAVCSEL